MVLWLNNSSNKYKYFFAVGQVLAEVKEIRKKEKPLRMNL